MYETQSLPGSNICEVHFLPPLRVIKVKISSSICWVTITFLLKNVKNVIYFIIIKAFCLFKMDVSKWESTDRKYGAMKLITLKLLKLLIQEHKSATKGPQPINFWKRT